MHDDLNAQNGPESTDRSKARETPGRSDRGRQDMPGAPLSDREVPIGVARTSDLVNAWLDGDISESQVIGTESARTVDFWKRLDRDLETRRAMTTPAHLQEQIMNALPQTVPSAAVSPWWERTISVSPIAVAAAAAGLLALGAVVGVSVRGR
jgi:hypothetical protein